jgi:hypothetical protein
MGEHKKPVVSHGRGGKHNPHVHEKKLMSAKEEESLLTYGLVQVKEISVKTTLNT